MKHIDRLLRKARKAQSPSVYSAFCIVDRDSRTGKWIAEPQIWDGKPGSGNMEGVIRSDWIREYDTIEEAVEAVDTLFQSLNIGDPDRLVLLVDDMFED